MILLKRKKIIAFFLIVVSVFFKVSIYNNMIVDYLNTLENIDATVLVASSQSDRTETDVFKKNDFSLAHNVMLTELCYIWKLSIINSDQGYQICYLRYWESTVSVFRIHKIIQIIFPFHNYF